MPNTHLAAPELAAVDVPGLTRGAFLLRGALAAGALYGGALAGPLVSRALAQGGDLEIVEFALALEHLEARFYERAQKEVAAMSTDVEELAIEIGEHELEHVDSLKLGVEELGGKVTKEPEPRFGDAFSSEEAFLRTAGELEHVGVGAYNALIPRIERKKLMATFASIAQVEARHLALVNHRRGASIAPDGAFTKPLGRARVREAIRPFEG